MIAMAVWLLLHPIPITQDIGIDLKLMDRNVTVQGPADLYRLANGTWLDTAKIPADQAWMGFEYDLYNRNQQILKQVAEEAVYDRSGDPTQRIVGQFYRQAMDEKKANRLGAIPLCDEFKRIDSVRSRAAVMAEIGHLATFPKSACFSLSINQDDNDNTRTLLTFSSGGLILDRQTYFASDPQAKSIRATYLRTCAKLLSLAGFKNGDEQAKASLALETTLAQAAVFPSERGSTHILNREDLQKLTPGAPWSDYFQELGVSPPVVSVPQPRFLALFGKAAKNRSLAEWRSYFRTVLLAGMSAYLSDRFQDALDELRQKTQGRTAKVARWKQAISATDDCLGEALSRLYVAKAFSPVAKERALALTWNLIASFRKRLEALDWMSDATKIQAINKLDGLRIRIGYPDKWRDTSKLHLKSDSYAQDVIRAQQFEWRRQLREVGRPLNPDEFGMTPSSSDAYYSAHLNLILFPAGILQPGYFSDAADDACNYGAIGSVIGHEITHGFDDHGSRFNLHGQLENWWTPADRDHFEKTTDEIVKQYEGYTSLEGMHPNGKFTLSENIADIGGLAVALDAYHRSLHGRQAPVIDGLTGDQRFFVAFAQCWRARYRPEFAKTLIENNPHSPAALRVLGAVSDCPGFYQAFGLSVPSNLPHLW